MTCLWFFIVYSPKLHLFGHKYSKNSNIIFIKLLEFKTRCQDNDVVLRKPELKVKIDHWLPRCCYVFVIEFYVVARVLLSGYLVFWVLASQGVVGGY